jgi:hypothetical protein
MKIEDQDQDQDQDHRVKHEGHEGKADRLSFASRSSISS